MAGSWLGGHSVQVSGLNEGMKWTSDGNGLEQVKALCWSIYFILLSLFPL